MKLLLATCRGRATAAAAAIRELIGADRNKESTREEEEEVLSLSKHIDQLSVLPKNEEKKYKGLVGDGGGNMKHPASFCGTSEASPDRFHSYLIFFFNFIIYPFIFC
jgi:hypothetical protein